MSEQGNAGGHAAKRGEKMIWLKLGFWTDAIAAGPGKIVPKQAWSAGVVRMPVNKTHGLKPGQPIPFESLPELLVAIEDLLIREGVTLHISRKMKKYLKGN